MISGRQANSVERPELRAELVDVEPSGNASIDALLSGDAWQRAGSGPTVITYSFVDEDSRWAGSALRDPGVRALVLSREELVEIDKDSFRQALATWENVANVRFVEVEDQGQTQGDIRVGAYVPGPGTIVDGRSLGNFTFDLSSGRLGGDIWFDHDTLFSVGQILPGSYPFGTMVHEIGHALGLKHPHESGGGFPSLPPAQDWFGTTVMSYRDAPGTTIDGAGSNANLYPNTPMQLDIAAIQHLYGAGPAHAGNTVHRWSVGIFPFQTVYDVGGTDRLDLTGRFVESRIDLRPGTWSRIADPYQTDDFTFDGNVFITADTVIENATGGSGADRITGNQVANVLRGGGDKDTLLGLGADDTLFGNDDDDLLDGGAGGDLARGGAGNDRLLGRTGDDVLRGGIDDDTLDGGSGADQLFGGGGDDQLRAGAGDDLINGGDGDDTLVAPGNRADYEVDLDGDGAGTLRDLVPEPVGTGTDTFTGIERIRFLDVTLDLATS